MTLPLEPQAPPAGFAAALAALTEELDSPARPGLELRVVPAPTRMAPHAVAVAADVERDGEEVASGRFVVLHDPAGQDGWRGDTRIVAFVSAEVEPEMAADPSLGAAGWSWLTDSLADVPHTAAGGTVTRTSSTRFGSLAEPEEACEVEVRASWTAVAGPDGLMDLGRHLAAWCDLLCSTAGLPPPGVAALR